MRRALPLVLALLLVPSLASLPPFAAAAETPEAGVFIANDASLAQNATKYGWAGSGTAASPYVISGHTFTANAAHGLTLQNTTKFVRIEDIAIAAGGKTFDGIRLVNVSNVTIQRADLQFNRACIHMERVKLVTVRDSTIKACSQGILLDRVNNSTFTNNQIGVSDEGIRFTLADQSRFRDNNLSIASGQIGFSFQDERSYTNDIDASNVVNFVPMQWHVNLSGTSASPALLADRGVHVKGITNVAQIMCYNCSYVTIRGAQAASGTASGIAIVASRNVTVAQSVAEGNLGAGIEVRRSNDTKVEGASASANGQGILVNSSNRTLVTGASVVSNALEGIRVFGGNANVVSSSLAQKNDEGVTLDTTNGTVVLDANLTGNLGDGLLVVNGRDHRLERATVTDNGGAGANLTGASNVTVVASAFQRNAHAGVVLGPRTALSPVVSNDLDGNGEAGIKLVSAGPLNRIEDNDLLGHAAHVRLAQSEDNQFKDNTMTIADGETGFWFEDEKSYNNGIGTSNVVNGTPMQWHVALLGNPITPIVLSGLRVEQKNITNVAQIMIYKGSYVHLQDAHAANGVRGIYVLRSSSAQVTGAVATDSKVGIELRGTLTVDVTGSRVERDGTGILVADTSNATLDDIFADGSRVAVEFEDVKSRGGVVQNVNATGVLLASVRDPSFTPGPPPRSNHLIVDAGLDKATGMGVNVTFSDAIGTARFGSEKILRQSWDFGDGETQTTQDETLLRPTHVYAQPGAYLATYTVATVGGNALSDSVLVQVFEGSPPPTNVTANRSSQGVRITWEAPPGPLVATGYRIYRGGDRPDNITFLTNSTGNATLFVENDPVRFGDAYYAVTSITAAGESPRSEPALLPASSPPPTAPTGGAGGNETATNPAPLSWALVPLAIALAALALRRRRTL